MQDPAFERLRVLLKLVEFGTAAAFIVGTFAQSIVIFSFGVLGAFVRGASYVWWYHNYVSFIRHIDWNERWGTSPAIPMSPEDQIHVRIVGAILTPVLFTVAYWMLWG